MIMHLVNILQVDIYSQKIGNTLRDTNSLIMQIFIILFHSGKYIFFITEENNISI